MSKRAHLSCLLIFGFMPAFVGWTTASPLEANNKIGRIVVMALDDSGKGWAWTDNAGLDLGAASSLVRIDNGSLHVVAVSSTSHTLLPDGLDMTRMAITADGKEGWAIGSVGRDMDTNGSPMLWRLQNGSWGVAKNNFAKDTGLYNLTMIADGSDGWMVTDEQGASNPSLLRLRNGDWYPAPEPDGAYVFRVASSPGGNQTWALGDGNPGTDIYHWTGWKWVLTYSNILPDRDPTQFAADDAGNAWLIGGSGGDEYLGEDKLIYFSDKAPPYQIALHRGSPEVYNGVALALGGLTLSRRSGGWISGGYQNMDPESVSYPNPVLIHLQDSTATLVEPQSAGITLTGDSSLGEVAISPDGTYSWVESYDRQDFSGFIRLRDPAAAVQPTKPAAAGVGYWPGLLAVSLLALFAGIAVRKRSAATRRRM